MLYLMGRAIVFADPVLPAHLSFNPSLSMLTGEALSWACRYKGQLQKAAIAGALLRGEV